MNTLGNLAVQLGVKLTRNQRVLQKRVDTAFRQQIGQQWVKQVVKTRMPRLTKTQRKELNNSPTLKDKQKEDLLNSGYAKIFSFMARCQGFSLHNEL